MPEANLETLEIAGLNPSELEQMRRNIVLSLTTTYKGYDDPAVPRELLHKLAVITMTLRRRNAGPPAKPKPPKGEKAKPKTLDDLLSSL